MLALALLVLAQTAPATASPSDDADKDLNAEKMFAKQEPTTPDGWKLNLNIGATGAMTRSTNVIGTVNGTTAQAGLLVDGGATLRHGLNSWENGLKITESFTRTPTIPHFLKSADEFRLQSTYLHRLEALQWLGPYARFLGTTSLFRGWNITPTGVDTIRRTGVDGNHTDFVTSPGHKYGTTKPFEPTLLRQSLGMFANALEGKEATLRTRVGAAMQELITQNGYALTDDATTPNILEYTQLRSSLQGGAEFDIETLGTIVENITYAGRAGFFYPIWETNDAQLTGSKLQTDISAKLSFHMSKYISLDYVLSAKRIPQIVEQWQVTNGILLSVAMNVIDNSKPTPPPAPPPAPAPAAPPTEAPSDVPVNG